MKTVMWVIVILAVLIGFFLFQRSTTRFLLFPPEDLFDPLVFSPVDISKPGNIYSFDFMNKYRGNHTIELAVDDAPPIGQSFNINKLNLNIQISSKSEVILHKIIEEPISSFWGGEYSGIRVMKYLVPEDLPEDEILTCRLEVTGVNNEIVNQYSNIRFVISRGSDK